MGEELNTSPQEEKTIEETFNDICPYLLATGCSYDDFWYKDTDIAKAYLKAFKIKQKQENEKLWLQGYYFYIALCDVAPVLNAFASRGTKVKPYPSEPLAISQEDVVHREDIARQNRLNGLKQKLLMSAKNGGQ